MPDEANVTFEVIAADVASQIFLVDGNFHLVGRGVGRAEFSAPPGIYKIKNRSGHTDFECMIVVRRGMAAITLDPVSVNSAIPLAGSTRTHEYHMAAASGAASAPDLSLGTGSGIIIIARQWSAQAPRSASTPPGNPARGLSLVDASGAVVADVAALTHVVGTLDPIVTLNVALSPGVYGLHLRRSDGTLVSQTVIASAGWQTCVYLLIDSATEDENARVDLVNAAITIAPLGAPFTPDDAGLRSEEIARGALAASRDVVSDAVRAQFTSADATPMLSLVGAHLLLRHAKKVAASSTIAPADELAGVRGIVTRLRSQLGAHPDVEALACAAGLADPGYVCDVPPMLRASWPMVLDASIGRPSAIPVDSITGHAAERIWGEGAWLQWLERGPIDAVNRTALWQARARELVSAVGTARDQLTVDRLPGSLAAVAAPAAVAGPTDETDAATHSLSRKSIEIATSVVHTTRNLFVSRVRTPFPATTTGATTSPPASAAEFGRARNLLTSDHRARLVKELGVPLSKIDAWLESAKE